MHYQQVNKYVL